MQHFDLSNKVAIVTGANSGIGRGMADGLAQAGATVAIAARNQEKSARAVAEIEAAGGRAMAVETDVTAPADIERMVARVLSDCGRVDILVNNAGTNVREMPEEVALETWRMIIDTNLTSTMLCSQAVYPAMKDGGGGKIGVRESRPAWFR